MRTKLEAARIASGFGCATIIACGREPHPLARLADGARATLVAPSGSPASAYKAWIKGTLAPGGSITIDDGAVKALAAGRSLLPAGVTRVEGGFDRGACVGVFDRAGTEVARGIAAYSAAEANLIRGRASRDIAGQLGYSRSDELIHRDDLVML